MGSNNKMRNKLNVFKKGFLQQFASNSKFYSANSTIEEIKELFDDVFGSLRNEMDGLYHNSNNREEKMLAGSFYDDIRDEIFEVFREKYSISITEEISEILLPYMIISYADFN